MNKFEKEIKLNSKLVNKDQWVLALHYDPKHNQGSDIYAIEPEELRLLSSLKSEKSDYLLTDNWLNNLIKTLKLEEKPKKDDIQALSLKC